MNAKKVKQVVDGYNNVISTLYPNTECGTYLKKVQYGMNLYRVDGGKYVEDSVFIPNIESKYDLALFNFNKIYPVKDQIEFLEDLTWSYKDMMSGKFEDFWVQYMVIPDVPKYYIVPDGYKYDNENVTLFYEDSDSNYIYGWYTFPTIIYFDKDAKNVYDRCLESVKNDYTFWSNINSYVYNYTNFVQKVENAWKSIYKHLSKTDEIIDYSDFLVHLKDDSIILSAFKDGVREDVWECHISAFSNEASISTACISTIIEMSK